MSDCKHCKNYQGNCGNHPTDQCGHIVYDEWKQEPGFTSCPDFEEGLNYINIYKEAYSHIYNCWIKDWRPADKLYTGLSENIPNAVLLYLDNGDRVIYIKEERED